MPTSTAFDGGLCCSWSMWFIDQEQRHPMPMGPVMKRLDRFDLCWPRRNARAPHPTGLFASLGAGLLVLDVRLETYFCHLARLLS